MRKLQHEDEATLTGTGSRLGLGVSFSPGCVSSVVWLNPLF